MKISVINIAGRNAVSSKDGEALYNLIMHNIADGHIELDFSGVEVFSTPFFNLGIGRLLARLSTDELNKKLEFQHLSPLGFQTLRRVIDNAKKHYAAPAPN
ncbi:MULTISPECIES: STAS-like domain-containing protein [unclassified Dyella]|uniref:STAS-like domain-containing protein n=1 Tax=unclassified Dyella TaxID=2634549 RepID=UPI003F8FCB57